MTTAVGVFEFSLPDVGEGLTEAEILSWHVAVGDEVAVNQIIVEIETAKAAVELPSPFAGRVVSLLVPPGLTIPVGTPIIQIDTGGSGGAAAGSPGAGGPTSPGSSPEGGASPEAGISQGGGAPAESDPAAGAKIGETMADGRVATLVGYIPAGGAGTRRARRGASPAPVDEGPVVSTSPTGEGSVGGGAERVGPAVSTGSTTGVGGGSGSAPLAAPQVRKLAKDLGVDLATVAPTRPDGVISRTDVEAAAHPSMPTGRLDAAPTDERDSWWVEERAARLETDPDGTGPRGIAAREIRVPVKGIRKTMAAAMVASAFTAPHVTEFLTVDVTPLMQLRDKLRARPDFTGVKITPLTFAARAVCLAARRTPEINAAWDGDAGELIYRNYVNLGIAAATPRGLVVPVLKDADSLDLRGLAIGLTELTDIARAGKTAPSDMTGGTFTITNVGVFGVDTGTPIINPGEAGILALGAIKDAPWVVDGQLAVRKICPLALSFDHRILDGQLGSQFLADVGALLSDTALAITY